MSDGHHRSTPASVAQSARGQTGGPAPRPREPAFATRQNPGGSNARRALSAEKDSDPTHLSSRHGLSRWIRALSAGARELRASPLRPDRLGEVAPQLADSDLRPELALVLQRLPDATLTTSPGLSLAAGIIAAGDDRSSDAERWLVHAQEIAGGSGDLEARIALELGTLYLRRCQRLAAESVLDWIEGRFGQRAAEAPSLVLLHALLAKHIGDHRGAIPLYRDAIHKADSAMTPVARVHALTNLAVALHHQDPAQGVGLCDLALATIDGAALDQRLRASALNIKGYAQICRGALRDARSTLRAARDAASRSDSTRVRGFAEFNLAIVDELEGSADAARRRLLSLKNQSSDLATWAQLRLAWLDLKDHRPATAQRYLSARPQAPEHYAEANATLYALVVLQAGDLATARHRLLDLARSYRDKDDVLTAWVLLLWCAHAEAKGGRDPAARHLLSRAREVAGSRGFVVSPNWWSKEPVATARHLERKDPYAAPLLPAHGAVEAAPPPVLIDRTAEVTVGDQPLSPDAWRVGRAGCGVLRRLFQVLLAAGPAGIDRSNLSDALWPESDGDRATGNLHAATSDLRRLLLGVPGVRVVVDGQRYRLQTDPNVSVETESSR